MVSEPIARSTERTSYLQILRSTSLIGISSIAGIAVGIVRMKVMALLLGPAGVGMMGIYMSILDLSANLAGAGVASSGVRQVAEAAGTGNSRRVQLTAKALKRLSLVLGIAGAVVLGLLAVPVSTLSFGNAGHTLAIVVLAVAVLLRVVSAGQGALIQGMRRIGDYARMNVLVAIAGTLITIPTIYLLGEDGIALSVLAFAATSLIGCWWYSRRLAEPVRLSSLRFRRESQKLLALGFAFLVINLLSTATAYVVRIIVLQASGDVAAGLYQAAWTIGGFYAGFVLQAMGMDFYPRLTAAAHDNSECARLVNEQTRIGILLAGPGVLVTLTLAPLVVHLLYSPEFLAAASLLRWICLGMMLRVISWPLGFIIIAKGAQRAMVLTEIAASIVHVGLAAMLVPLVGAEGAGVAFFGLYVFHMLLMLFITRRIADFRWTRDNLLLMAIQVSASVLVTLGFLVLPFWIATAIGMIASCIIGIGALVALSRLVPVDALPKRLRPFFGERRGMVP